MMTPEDLIREYIGSIINDEERVMQDHFGHIVVFSPLRDLRQVIANQLRSFEWFLMGYDTHLFSVLLRMGDQFLLEDNIKIAKKFFSEAIHLFPHVALGYVKIAECHHRKGDHGTAKRKCIEAISICKKAGEDLPAEYMMKIAEILTAANDLDRALNICYKMLDRDHSNFNIQRRIKEIERKMERRAEEKERRENEKKTEASIPVKKKTKNVLKTPAKDSEPKVKKSLKEMKKEEYARQREIDRNIAQEKERMEEIKKKKEEEMEKRKEKEGEKKEKESPVGKTTGPSIGYDVNAALEVTRPKKGSKKSSKSDASHHSNRGVGSLQQPQQLSVAGKLSVDKIPSNMDQTLSSGAVVRRFCPKCSSPRDIKFKTPKCHSCQSDLKLRYKKVNGKEWIEPRKPPNNVLGKYIQCKHYQLGRPCAKTPCKFAHGRDELEIWELCRGKGIRKTRSKTSQNATIKKSSSCMTLFEGDMNTGNRSRAESYSSLRSLQASFPPFDVSSCGNSVNGDGLDDSDSQSMSELWYGLSQDSNSESCYSVRSTVSTPLFGLSGHDTSPSGRSTSEDTTEQTYSLVTEDVQPDPATTSTTVRADLGEEESEEGWTTVGKKGKKTNSVTEPPRKKVLIRCRFCEKLLTTADEPQVIRKRSLCKTCNRTEWPVQQFWDDQAERFRSLRRKPSGIKNVKNIQICWHYKRKNEHQQPDCRFAHGVVEKKLWEKEIEEGTVSTKKKGKPAVTAQEKPPPKCPSSALNFALLFLEKEKLRCRHCDVSFSTLRELEHHNSEPQHKIAVMGKIVTQPEAMSEPESEMGVKCRPPPDGVRMGRYKLCPRFKNGWCSLDDNCTFAHGTNELEQWVKIYKRQNEHLSRLWREKLLRESFSQKIQQKINTEGRGVLKKSLPGITMNCSSSYEVNLNNTQDYMWIFDVRVKTVQQKLLKQVAFLKEDHLDKFRLLKSPDENEITSSMQSVEFTEDDFVEDRQEAAVQFCVKFSSLVFGTFEQELILDFDSEFYLSQSLSVSVMSDDFRKNKINQDTRQSVLCQILEWSMENMELILCNELIDETGLRDYYNIPREPPDPAKIDEFTPEMYCTRWHDVLFIEELHIHQEIARYDMRNAQMNLITTFKGREETVFATPGELFGEISLKDHLFMDEVSGHLIQRSVLSVIVRPKQRHTNGTKVYECAIRLTTDQSVVVKVNPALCKDLSLQNGNDVRVDLKFKYNRLPMSQMHETIDRCRTKTSLLFPAVTSKQNIPKESVPTWFMMDDKPNDNQLEAIKMILGPGPAPPLLLIGPFGTGKTYTLNMACVRILRKSRDNKVLICTHSNSAADIHLRLLHKKILEKQDFKRNLLPLRIVDTRRDVATIPGDLRNYCLLDGSNQLREATWNDLRTHNVIITTLATSRVLWPFYDEGQLSFTHILIDEAAQALEPESVSPLTMADDTTKVALAGDHIQMGPLTYSKGWLDDFGPKRSLLQRLFAHYKTTVCRELSVAGEKDSLKPPSVVMLTENYRCHEDILNFPSEIFYGGELIARGNQPKHPSIPALSFYTAQGQDEKLEGSLSYYNLAEVDEVVRRVEELVASWPKDWKQSIGVLAPYRDQVQKIRAALRRKGFYRVNVQTVENVQGQEFKALFISTVRTGYTCWGIEKRNFNSEDLDFGFLSDERLLNTAVTRAQSLLAVVGDPMSLCTIGACQEIWKKYLQSCDRNNGLHGCTLKIVKDFCLSNRALNPDAQEFTPSQATNEADGDDVQSSTSETTVPVAAHALVNTTSGSPTPGKDESSGDVSSPLPETGGNPDLPSTDQMKTRKVNPASDSPQSLLQRSEQEHTQKKEGQNPSAAMENQEDGKENSVESSMVTESNKAVENGLPHQLRESTAASVGPPDEASSVLTGEDNENGLKDEEDPSTKDFFSFEDDENYDEIINALVQACRETKKNDELEQNRASNKDFPPLSTAEIPQTAPQWPRQTTPGIFSAGMRNGRIELGFHIKESERLFRLTGGHSSTQASGDSSYNVTRAFTREELVNLLKINPECYSQCTVRIDTSGRQRRYYGQVPDPDSPDILIPGRVRGVFEDDVVVVEMQQSRAFDEGGEQTKRGFIKGVLRTPINPEERQFVCTVDSNNLGIMLPINKSKPKLVIVTNTNEKGIIPIYISKRKAVVLRGKEVKDAMAGQIVFVVRVLQWRVDCLYPLGLAVRRLRYGKDFETGMKILYEEYNVKRTFSEKVESICEQKYKNAEEWTIPVGEKARPLYCTDVFTVDPPESRDLDDAISIRVLSNGNYQVHIHIADVSYFVPQNTELDDEARSRGTSYYPPKPQEVVPMLPRELSEGCCSILEGKDRLAMTLSVELSSDGTVVGEPKIERSIVRSCCRLTYAEAQEIINEGRGKEDHVDHEVKSSGVTAVNSCGFDVEDDGVVARRGSYEGQSECGPSPLDNPGHGMKTSGDEGLSAERKKKKKKKESGEMNREEEDESEKEQEASGSDGDVIEAGENIKVLEDMKDIPETESGSMKKKKKISEGVKKAILLVNKLAINRRKTRLGERSFHHRQDDDDEDDTESGEAHEMIAEMMIMANHLVAKYLLSKFPDCTPLRVQLPPKTRRVEEWKLRFQKYARYSLGIKSLADADQEGNEMAEPDIMVPSKTWDKIMSALSLVVEDDSNFQELVKLVCNLDQYPQLALAYANQQRLQQRASYTCSGEAPVIVAGDHKQDSENVSHENTSSENNLREIAENGHQEVSKNISQEDSKKVFRGHSSLELDAYCHFTSPIRRYIDVIVHRLLVACSDPQRSGNQSIPYTSEDVTSICDRCTFLTRNSGRFDKDARKLQLSVDLQNSMKFVKAWIDEVTDDSLKLFFGHPKFDLLQGKDKSVRIARLGPNKNPKMDGDGMTLEWRFRLLRLDKEGHSQPKAEEGDENAMDCSNSSEPNRAKTDLPDSDFTVPGEKWRNLLDAVKNENRDLVKKCVQDLNDVVQQQSPSRSSATVTLLQKVEDPSESSNSDTAGRNSREFYQHPNTGQPEPEVQETDEFYAVTKSFKPCDLVKVQLCSQILRGMLSPNIQLFEIADKMNVCVEHRTNPTKCFAKVSSHYASQSEYDDMKQYIVLWKPVLMMEIATSAVREDDVITLSNLCVTLSRGANGELSMKFALFKDYCKRHKLDVFDLNLMCVRIKDPRSRERGAGFWVGHFQIKQSPKTKENQRKEQKDGNKEEDEEEKKDDKVFYVEAQLVYSSAPVPEVLVEKTWFVTAELICLSIPDRRRLGALVDSDGASELIQNICVGEVSAEDLEGCQLPREDLSLAKMEYGVGFKPLNRFQQRAVEHALTKPFTLIQGPPGTGKTVTGVHIAYWFAHVNRTRRDDEPVSSMVFYCGPSNKSVDVVGRYLKKIPELKILRIYGQTIERKEFPVPDRITAFREKLVSSQLKADEELKDVSLHHVIRSDACPFSEEIKQYDDDFRAYRNRDAPSEMIDKYEKLITKAEKWAIMETGVNVILCTCTAAFSPRIMVACFAHCQCIVDECGMCIEAETLCAMLGCNATQVVLIGDHKQLQPVIQNDKAKDLGLGISMFERYYEYSLMLEIQYRMHQEICKFPSDYFYEGKLKTADIVLKRTSKNIPLWPNGPGYPFVFYHLEGEEESLVVSTNEGNENSKRNRKEINKVVHSARTLVSSGVREEDVVIMSPYRAQCFEIGEQLKQHGLKEISVMTVVAGQGSEKDYVILSLVRSLPEKEIEKKPSRAWLSEHLGFLTDEHQINVALTRSRRGLCIVGNANLVGVCDVWKAVLHHYQAKGCLVSDDPTLTISIEGT